MLNETETALNVNSPCSCKYSIIFCLMFQPEPRIRFRSPPGPLSDDSRRTQKYAPTGVVFQISIPQAHILYIEYRRMFLSGSFKIGLRTDLSASVIEFCCGKNRCESCRIAAVHLTYPVYHAVFSLSTPNHLNLPAFFCRIWQKTVLLCLRCTFFCIDITFSYL